MPAPGNASRALLAGFAAFVSGAATCLDGLAAWTGRLDIAAFSPLLLPLAAATVLASALLARKRIGRSALPLGLAAAAAFLASAALRWDGHQLDLPRWSVALALDLAGNVATGALAVRAAASVEDERPSWAPREA